MVFFYGSFIMNSTWKYRFLRKEQIHGNVLSAGVIGDVDLPAALDPRRGKPILLHRCLTLIEERMELDSPRRDGGLCPLGQCHLQQLRLHLPQASGPVRDPPLPKRKGDCGNTVLQNIRQRLGMSFHLPAVMVQHKIDDDFCEVRQCQCGVQPVIRCAALPEIRQHASGQFRLGFQIQQPEPALHNSLQIRPPRRFIFYRDAESLDDCVAGLADQFPVVHCQCPGQSLAGPLFLRNLDAVLFTERHLVGIGRARRETAC